MTFLHRQAFWVATLVFLMMALLSARPLFFQNSVPVNGNVLREHYPNWQWVRSSWLSGQVPQWNPYKDMGEPGLADPKTMALYPGFIAFGGFPNYSDFLKGWIIFHTGLCCFFMWRLTQRWYGNVWASTAAMAVAAFNGFFTGRMPSPNHFASAAYLPAVLYFIEIGSAPGLGISLALQWLAGFPPFSVLSVCAAAGVTILRRGRHWSAVLKGGVYAVGLSAVQLLPFLEFMRQSTRPLLLDPVFALDYSEPWRQLLTQLVVPQWFYFSPSLIGDPSMVCFYVGVIALGFSIYGALTGGRREKWGMAAILATLLLSLGKNLPGYSHVPFLMMFRFPAHWLLLSSVGIALLTGAGVSRLKRAGWQVVGVLLLLVDLLAFCQYARVAWLPRSFLGEIPRLVQGGLVSRGRIFHPVLFDAAWQQSPFNQWSDYVLMKESLTPSYGTAFGLREARSYQVMKLKNAQAYLNRLEQDGTSSPRLAWAGISTVVTLSGPGKSMTMENLRVVHLPGAKPPLFAAVPSSPKIVAFQTFGPGVAEGVIQSSAGATVVLSEVEYPGWQAWLDHRPVPHSLFEKTFMAVQVPAGEHRLLFRFQSRALTVGSVVSLFTFAWLGIAGLWSRKRCLAPETDVV